MHQRTLVLAPPPLCKAKGIEAALHKNYAGVCCSMSSKSVAELAPIARPIALCFGTNVPRPEAGSGHNKIRNDKNIR